MSQRTSGSTGVILPRWKIERPSMYKQSQPIWNVNGANVCHGILHHHLYENTLTFQNVLVMCVCRTSVYSGTSWIFRWCIRKSPIPLIESTFLEMTRSDTIPVFPKGLNVKGKGPSHGFVRPVAPPLLCYCMTSIYQRMRFFPCKLIYIYIYIVVLNNFLNPKKWMGQFLDFPSNSPPKSTGNFSQVSPAASPLPLDALRPLLRPDPSEEVHGHLPP